VGASNNEGGCFQKGQGQLVGGLVMFDIGVLGLAFWALDVVHWQVLTWVGGTWHPGGHQHSGGRCNRGLPGAFLVLLVFECWGFRMSGSGGFERWGRSNRR